tara:strand:+ start:1031 stop:3247 length:2217 start_codon:yes stop_codon:yes gene_type:complete
MLSAALIIDNLKREETTDYKKLCKLLKFSKKDDKAKLNIALEALERLEIISKNDKNEYLNIKDKNHITAKIRCSSKGYCFAVRDNNSEDIYIKENLLNYAWNGDKVLVRIIKEGIRRRSPEGIVDCILEREHKYLLARVQIIEGQVYGVPIDDRILSKIKLPLDDKKYLYLQERKNIVKIQIDMFPIAQIDGIGHVISELDLCENEKLDEEFVLSKNNIILNNQKSSLKLQDPQIDDRLDLSTKNAFMFKSWNKVDSPLLPLFQFEKDNLNNSKLWIHTNSIAERIDFDDKNLIEFFNSNFSSFLLSDRWNNFLDKDLLNLCKFEIGKTNKSISLCLELSKNFEIVDWSFHLTQVNCVAILDNKLLEAINKNNKKSRITSRILKPIKDYLEEINQILEISQKFRDKQISRGIYEIRKEPNNIDSLEEFYVHKPGSYENNFFEPLNINDIQTYLSPILFEADSIWFQHSSNFNVLNANYSLIGSNKINVNEIIKNTQLLESDLELDNSGNLSIDKLLNLYVENNKIRIINKYLINNSFKNKVNISNSLVKEDKFISILSPWTLPSFDFVNLINQYSLFNMFKNAKTSRKGSKEVNIFKKDSWNLVNWNLFNASNKKVINSLFNDNLIEKYNICRTKYELFRSNYINIKQIREAEKLISKSFKGLIISVQSYGFFVELPDLYVEGLVHVSTLNDDWYEYRSRQNLLVGRKSKNTFRVGDLIEIKIVKVDILKYQIDLEIT